MKIKQLILPLIMWPRHRQLWYWSAHKDGNAR